MLLILPETYAARTGEITYQDNLIIVRILRLTLISPQLIAISLLTIQLVQGLIR